MNYDDWLEAPFQEAEARANAIDSITESLLSGDYQPENIDNFNEALGEGCLDTEVVQEKLKAAIAVGVFGHQAIGKVIWDAVYAYWYDQAAKKAIDIHDSGNHYDDF